MEVLLFVIGSVVVCSVFWSICYSPFKFLENVQKGYKRG